MLSLDLQEAALCSTSPTGKHHWMIPMLGAHPVGICKWCEAERRFDNTAGDGHWDYGERHSQITRQRMVGNGTQKQHEEASRLTPYTW